MIRPYEPGDAESWLRCRVLGFLATDYYDDVATARPAYDHPAICLVAVEAGEVIGLIDVAISYAAAATIEVIAVHPDHQHGGIGSRLLEAAISRLAPDVRTLDAWTREDVAANAWYRSRGFTEAYRYLHVYKGSDDDAEGFATPAGMSAPVHAFMHAPIEQESELRERFGRIYVCRQYLREL